MTSGLGSGADAVLAAALERLIPDDEHGPGALEAGVGRYVDGALERAGDEMRRSLAGRPGGARRARSRARGRRPSQRLLPAAQDRVLEAAADGALARVLRGAARGARSRACSAIRRGAATRTAAGWRLLGYPGPRHVWSADDQRIAEIPPRP